MTFLFYSLSSSLENLCKSKSLEKLGALLDFLNMQTSHRILAYQAVGLKISGFKAS